MFVVLGQGKTFYFKVFAMQAEERDGFPDIQFNTGCSCVRVLVRVNGQVQKLEDRLRCMGEAKGIIFESKKGVQQ